MAKKHYVKICFSASGWINQDIEVTDPDMTAERMVEMLASGDAITTVHEDNDVLALPDFRTIGKVLYSETELEYFDFEAEDTYDLHHDDKPFNASQLALQGAVGEYIFDPDGELTCGDILSELQKFPTEPPTTLPVEERYSSMTGKELLWEIKAMAEGLTNFMKVAYEAGKEGQEFK